MKINKAQPSFAPIVITLETQEEVDILRAIACKIAGSGKIRNFTDKLWHMGCDASPCSNQVEGILKDVSYRI